jgi:hypothetical protein
MWTWIYDSYRWKTHLSSLGEKKFLGEATYSDHHSTNPRMNPGHGKGSKLNSDKQVYKPRLSLLENGFGNLDLWALESFGKVIEILTAQGVRTPTGIGLFYSIENSHYSGNSDRPGCVLFSAYFMTRGITEFRIRFGLQ